MTLTEIVSAVATFFGVTGTVLAILALRRARRAVDDCRDLLTRQAVIGAGGIDGRAIRDVAVYRYDAPQETGRRSFSAAFLNSMGDGLVLTALNGRAETRTYVRPVRGGRGVEPLSPEEERVVRAARLGQGPEVEPAEARRGLRASSRPSSGTARYGGAHRASDRRSDEAPEGSRSPAYAGDILASEPPGEPADATRNASPGGAAATGVPPGAPDGPAETPTAPAAPVPEPRPDVLSAPAPTPAQDATPDPVPHARPGAVSEAVPEAASDTVSGTVSGTVSAAASASASDPSDPVADYGSGPASESPSGTASHGAHRRARHRRLRTLLQVRRRTAER
ncbi:uncharacterized protein DUF4446 [Thermopolyspora flexuosa]|uniref:Uncharacterized protein DUF4446 n=1 Tax=Thermopolyspora flexuosa TaxID=103836 RepID=A0A543IPD9_9ACTN|nr:DUF4446 family protein [Thermopolyspora flexuosa]TQM72444.1 uncharacterized protein DUF4446 [Thermopolyspora flexuosa]